MKDEGQTQLPLLEIKIERKIMNINNTGIYINIYSKKSIVLALTISHSSSFWQELRTTKAMWYVSSDTLAGEATKYIYEQSRYGFF